MQSMPIVIQVRRRMQHSIPKASSRCDPSARNEVPSRNLPLKHRSFPRGRITPRPWKRSRPGSARVGARKVDRIRSVMEHCRQLFAQYPFRQPKSQFSSWALISLVGNGTIYTRRAGGTYFAGPSFSASFRMADNPFPIPSTHLK